MYETWTINMFSFTFWPYSINHLKFLLHLDSYSVIASPIARSPGKQVSTHNIGHGVNLEFWILKQKNKVVHLLNQ